jgi:hypothetical protein
MAVNKSAAQRAKKTRKFSDGGPESGPLLFHSINVTGTNTAAPSISPSVQTLRAVSGRHRERRNNAGRKRNPSCAGDDAARYHQY